MRKIDFDTIAETVESLCIEAAFKLPPDVFFALQQAKQKEQNPLAKDILEALIENARIAEAEKIPLCQDTGLAVVFIEQGSDIFLECGDSKTLNDAVNLGVGRGYEKAYLRKSVVSEPLKERKNTGTNCPAIIHHSFIHGDKIKISLMAKGGGCENKSQFKMFKPTADKQLIIDWISEVVISAGADACPPFVVGVGMGGNFELSCLLAKKALLRDMRQENSDPFYNEMEKAVMEAINSSDIGPQGFGGNVTALGCMIETAPCHIASLPVAVNIECHSHRHCSTII